MPIGNRKYVETKVKTKQASTEQKRTLPSPKVISNKSVDKFKVAAMRKQEVISKG